jgi:hypothetical protein
MSILVRISGLFVPEIASGELFVRKYYEATEIA